MKRIIPVKRSIMVAADVNDFSELARLVEATVDVSGVSSYKLGFLMAMLGLKQATDIIRDVAEKFGKNPVIIYDHQKAGTDIPDMGKKFARMIKHTGVDAVILFPFAGPATQRVWTEECQAAQLGVLTGGVMTHANFLKSEGGYIDDDAVLKIYELAVNLGVNHFVVPGTKINWVKRIRELLDGLISEGEYVLNAPGFIKQDGIISECGQVAGNEWHAIVGSAIYEKMASIDDMREAVTAVSSQIIAQ